MILSDIMTFTPVDRAPRGEIIVVLMSIFVIAKRIPNYELGGRDKQLKCSNVYGYWWMKFKMNLAAKLGNVGFLGTAHPSYFLLS